MSDKLRNSTFFVAVGGCGSAVAKTMWELFMHEHSVYPDGTLADDRPHYNISNVYSEALHGWAPNAMFLDMNSNFIDYLKMSKYKNHFSHESYVTDHSSSGGNYAYCLNHHHDLISKMKIRLRKMLEQRNTCDSLLLFQSCCGGSSALSEAVLDFVDVKTTKIVFEHHQSFDMVSSILTPYNTILSTARQHDRMNLKIPFENSKVVDFLHRVVKRKQILTSEINMNQYSYRDINEVLAWCISNITHGRFSTDKNATESIYCNFEAMTHNLVPFVDLKYITLSPFSMNSDVNFNPFTYKSKLTFRDMLESDSELVYTNEDCKSLAVVLSFRGNISFSDVKDTVEQFKKDTERRFVRWIPSHIRCCFTRHQPKPPSTFGVYELMTSLVKLENKCGINQVIYDELDDFCGMYNKGCYLHLYTKNGVYPEEFEDCFEKVKVLGDKYEEISGKSVKVTQEEVYEQMKEEMDASVNDVPDDVGFANIGTFTPPTDDGTDWNSLIKTNVTDPSEEQ